MRKNISFFNRRGKAYLFGIVLVCGFLLTSYDDCESQYLMEQEQGSAKPVSSSQSSPKPSQPVAVPEQKAAVPEQKAAVPEQKTGSETKEAAAHPKPADSTNVTSIFGKAWNLTEIRLPNRTIHLNRNELKGNQADIFTMVIDKDRISGKGAPNRYFTSYKAGPDNTLTLQPIAGTMMASLAFDPERIHEAEYFQYLAKVTSWKLNQNKLELTSTDAADKSLVMVFISH